MSTIAAFIGRIMLAALFVFAGIDKIIDPSKAAGMLQGANLPASLALPTGAFEIVAGLLLAMGFLTRLVSIVLAGFVLLTVAFFHNRFGDPAQGQLAIKNIAIAGGLLVVFAYGQMRWSYDHIRTTRRGELAAAEAEARAHEAELRAARAEGRAEAVGTVPVARGPVLDRDRDGHIG